MLLATKSTVYRIDESSDDEAPQRLLNAQNARHIAFCDGTAFLATRDGNILALTPDGKAAELARLDHEPTCLIVLSADPLRLLVGTEEAHLYEVLQGCNPTLNESLESLPCRINWRTPWGGPPAVRSLAAPNETHVYADIHVGSIMRSADGGVSWAPVTPTLDDDVHQIAASPQATDRVYANTASGVYISEDRGESWDHRADDLDARYGRAIAVHPADPDCLMATVSDGPMRSHARGELFRSDDAGRNWSKVTDGFPVGTESNIDTFHIGFSIDGAAWAVVGRQLFKGSDRGFKWREYWQAPEPIRLIAVRQ
jgi:hypothetical protein